MVKRYQGWGIDLELSTLRRWSNPWGQVRLSRHEWKMGRSMGRPGGRLHSEVRGRPETRGDRKRALG